MKKVIVLIGAGSIGQACARRVGIGKTVVLADLKLENAEAAASDELKGPRGDGYRRMIEISAVGRAGTPDEWEQWPHY